MLRLTCLLCLSVRLFVALVSSACAYGFSCVSRACGGAGMRFTGCMHVHVAVDVHVHVQVVHGTASKDAIAERLAKWATAAGKEVRFVKEM